MLNNTSHLVKQEQSGLTQSPENKMVENTSILAPCSNLIYFFAGAILLLQICTLTGAGT